MTDVPLRKDWLYHQIHGKPSKVYVGLGSNLGDREENLAQAIEQLSQVQANQVLKTSSVYETEPVGCEGEWFLNQAVYLITLLPVDSFFEHLQFIETELGRENQNKNLSRPIDLDILFFGDEVVAEPNLQIPHPRLHERRFVLEPLNEINSHLWHPIFKKTTSKLLSEAPDTHEVRPYTPVLS